MTPYEWSLETEEEEEEKGLMEKTEEMAEDIMEEEIKEKGEGRGAGARGEMGKVKWKERGTGMGRSRRI